MKLILHVHCLLCAVVCILVQADIGKVQLALNEQLYICLHESNSLRESLNLQRQCLESLFQCLAFFEPCGKNYMNIHMNQTEIQLCGGLNTGEHFKSDIFQITVNDQLGIYFVIHYFRFPSDDVLCKQASVRVEMKNFDYIFCGYRVPWNISSPNPYATVELQLQDDTLPNCHFVVSFEAFDVSSQSVGLVQENHQLFGNDTTSSFMHLRRHIEGRRAMKTEIQLHIFTLAYKQIVVTFCPALFGVQIYDGPGPLSPRLTAKEDSHTCQTISLSSYQGFIKYYVPSLRNIIDVFYDDKILFDKSKLHWRSTDILDTSKDFDDCVHYTNTATHFRTTSGYCKPQQFHSYLTIHQLRFTGFDTLYDISAETCHYGGLFILFYPPVPNTNGYYRLCSNITATSVLPYVSLVQDSDILIIFKTFKGYSNGYVDMTIPLEKDCYGRNLLFGKAVYKDRCIQANLLKGWMDKRNTESTNIPTTHCLDLWLAHNIIRYESSPSPFPNCPFNIIGLQLKSLELVGRFELFISSATIIYQSKTFMHPNYADDWVMEIKRMMMNGFPTDLNVTGSSITVPLSSFAPSRHMFNITTGIKFLPKHLAKNLPIIAIRLQFLMDRVCSSEVWNNISDFYPVYRLSGNVLLLALSNLEPNIAMLKLLNKTGHIHGPCRMIIEGGQCIQSLTQIVQIFFRPHISTPKDKTHKIDIAMKGFNCSYDCYLNISILENIKIYNNNRGKLHGFRFHEWQRIYRLTWYASVSRGYSIQINSSCSQPSCSRLCNIAVSVVLHRWKEVFDRVTLPFYKDDRSLYEYAADCLKDVDSRCKIFDAIQQQDLFGLVNSPQKGGIPHFGGMHEIGGISGSTEWYHTEWIGIG